MVMLRSPPVRAPHCGVGAYGLQAVPLFWRLRQPGVEQPLGVVRLDEVVELGLLRDAAPADSVHRRVRPLEPPADLGAVDGVLEHGVNDAIVLPLVLGVARRLQPLQRG